MRRERRLLLTFLLFASPSFSSARSWTDIVSDNSMRASDSSVVQFLIEKNPFISTDETGSQTNDNFESSAQGSSRNETAPVTGYTSLPSSTPFPTKSTPTNHPTTSLVKTRHPLTQPPTLPTNIPSTTDTTNKPVVTPKTAPPTVQPTAKPTEAPVTDAPTADITLAPTVDLYPENPPPDNPNPSYFNYDTRRSNSFGPGYPELFRYNESTIAVGYRNNGWATREVPDDFYWNEFDEEGYGPWKGTLARRSPSRNRCDRVGMQSPIDLRPNGAQCNEHHEVRSRPGDFSIYGDDIEKRIESNKLRLVYRRRPCSNMTDVHCSEPDPPHADFPNNWGGYADLMHVDFKIPSEHLIDGQRFDAEMQIYHLHPGRRRTPTVVSLMNVTEGGYNIYLQPVLDAFEFEYNVHQAQCADSIRRERKLVSDMNKLLSNSSDDKFDYYSTWAEYSTYLDRPGFAEEAKKMERQLQAIVWDPHNEALVPSIYFYGYDGSLTEPPCAEFVSWFVCDKPMTISSSQLEQMKRLLFTHVAPDCTKTSVHYRQSVARPIQDTAGRPVWLCTEKDYGPDQWGN